MIELEILILTAGVKTISPGELVYPHWKKRKKKVKEKKKVSCVNENLGNLYYVKIKNVC